MKEAVQQIIEATKKVYFSKITTRSESRGREYKHKDFTGQRFGMLFVVSEDTSKKKYPSYWICLCDCGAEKSIRSDVLKPGRQQSCGCRAGSPTHKMSNTKIFRQWSNMIQRCENKNNPSYKNYGGRGITVCSQWKSFEKFYEDMGDRPKNMSLDRINNSEGYSKNNCQWAESKTQNRNRRDNKIIEIDGIKRCLAEWCEIYNQPYYRVLARISSYGYSAIDALKKPKRGQK